jgi:hypothetical protein
MIQLPIQPDEIRLRSPVGYKPEASNHSECRNSPLKDKFLRNKLRFDQEKRVS